MKTDDQLISGLSIAHYIVGAMTLLSLPATLLLVGFGAFMILMAGGSESLSRQTGHGWVAVVVGAGMLLIVLAVTVMTIIAGSKIRRRQSWKYCIVVSCVQIINVPIGSVLGILTLLSLNKHSIKSTFDSCKNSSIPGSRPMSISPPALPPRNTTAKSASKVAAPRPPSVSKEESGER